MDLDLHFTTLFSVVGKHLMRCSANICNKPSCNNFSSKRRVFGSSSNSIKNYIASIPQSTEFVCCWTRTTFVFSTFHLLASMRIFLALQNQLFGPKITLIINFSVFTIKCADSNPMTPVAQISDFSLLSARMFDQVRE